MRRELDGRSRRSSTGSACRVCAAALITPEGQRNPIQFDSDQHTRSLTSCLLSSGDRTASMCGVARWSELDKLRRTTPAPAIPR